ncbi:MAG: MBL fold metallo-hydrolase [Patescibacteria group bacterium]
MQKLWEQLHWWILAALFVATFFVWYAVVWEDRSGLLTVAFLDVGQGDAIFIESPTGVQVVVDGGPDRSVLRQLGRVMPFYDRTIDMLLVTNPDKDHFAGFLDVLRAYRVGTVMEPGTVGASAEYRALEQMLGEKIPPASRVLPLQKGELPRKITALRGQRIELGGGAYFEVLFPDRDVSGLDTNDGSIVAKLIYGNTSFLLTGDTTSAVEGYLAQLDGKRLDVAVLKVGHHGSKTSTSDALLGFASPAMAVISAGKDNRYGHPHQEVLERLKQFEVETLGTYERGTIIMESDGETVRITPRANPQRRIAVGVKK